MESIPGRETTWQDAEVGVKELWESGSAHKDTRLGHRASTCWLNGLRVVQDLTNQTK